MKRMFSRLLVCLVLTLALCGTMLPRPASAAAVFDGGSGTAANPYLISTAAQLNQLRNSSYNSKHFKLTADITFAAADFESGGTYYNGGIGWDPISFAGTLDGDGHTIRGLYQTISSKQAYGGVFSKLSGATVKDLNLVDCSIQVNAGASNYATCYAYVGGIAGYLEKASSISNCTVSGTIQVNNSTDRNSKSFSYVGGIVGYLAGENGTLTGCKNEANVTSSVIHEGGGTNGYYDYVGGIVGYINTSASVADCCNLGALEFAGYGGGIAGRAQGSIQRCYNAGNIDGNTDKRKTPVGGGIAGDAGDATEIGDCFNYGDFSGYKSGGIIGSVGSSASGLAVRNCYSVSHSSIIGQSYASSLSVQACYYIRSSSGSSGISGTYPKRDDQLRTQGTFSGWDFTDVWTMEGNPEYPYPELQSVETEVAPSDLVEVTISGDTIGEIPFRDAAATMKLTALASYQNSFMTSTKDVTSSADWSVLEAPEGVSISKGILSVAPSAEAGDITVQASYNGKTATHVVTLIKVDPCANGHSYSAGLCSLCGKDTLSVSLDGTLLTLSGEIAKGTNILAAGYDGSERFVASRFFVWQGDVLVEELFSAETVKLFFLDGDWSPLREHICLP